jgi:hypothetical protein
MWKACVFLLQLFSTFKLVYFSSGIKGRKIDIIDNRHYEERKRADEIGEYTFIYSGDHKDKTGAPYVGMILRIAFKSSITGYSWIDNKIVTLKIERGETHCCIIGMYATVR